MTFHSSPEGTAFAAVARQAAQQPRHGTNGGKVAPPVTLTVPVPPSANEWHRHVGKRVLLSSVARKYLREINSRFQHLTPMAGPLRLSIVWYRARKAGDVDKRGAILLDALQGLAYENDSQIADYRIVRDDSEPKAARMVVTISQLEQ